MTKITKSELARLVKTSPQQINSLINSSVLRALPDGKMDKESSMEALRRYSLEVARPQNQRDEKHRETMRKLKAQCDLLEIERRKLEGDLMDRAEYIEARAIIITTCKNILLTLPSRVGAPFPDVALKIEAHANQIVTEVLTRLSDEGEYKKFGEENEKQ